MGVRDKDEDEEDDDDDEKRSQRLGMVRTDTKTFADELGIRQRRRRCKTRGARTWRQSGGCSRRGTGDARTRTPEASPRRDRHLSKGHLPASAVSENCWDGCR